MGVGVSSAVFDPDVESGSALFYCAGREACLHYGGVCILSEWAPFSGNTPTGRSCVTCGMQLATLGWRYCLRENFMSGSIVSIVAMDALVHCCVAVMIVRVYGSLVTQRISGGQLRVMGRALDKENFPWGLMLHAKMVG
jgi:hypothetical protein